MTIESNTRENRDCDNDSSEGGTTAETNEAQNYDSLEGENFCFQISLTEDFRRTQQSDDQPYNRDHSAAPPLHPPSKKPLLDAPQSIIERFQEEGFCVFERVLDPKAVNALNDRLEDVLRGRYDRNRAPDKVPKRIKSPKPAVVPIFEATRTAEEQNACAGNVEEKSQKQSPVDDAPKKKKSSKGSGGIGPIGFSGNYQNVKVLQIINIHKADSLYRRLGTDPQLAHLVTQLARWPQGARLAQDQVWAKPPGAPPLVYHRDSPYFMFEPNDVVTVWIALDDMSEELGPLEYVVGSHNWGDGRVGSARQFFQSSNVHNLLQSAASCEGLTLDDLTIISMKGIKAGSLSIHHGKIWHGSNKNRSKTKPRRGLGLHFVPANVRFTQEAQQSKLWKPYVEGVDDPSKVELSQEDFPTARQG